MSHSLSPFYVNFKQALINGSLAGVTAPSITDVLLPLPKWGDQFFPRAMCVAVKLAGTITNTEIAVSVEVTDANGLSAWTVLQTQEVRALPDSSVAVGMFTIDTLNAASLRIALESTITGGGSARIFYCFQSGDTLA